MHILARSLLLAVSYYYCYFFKTLHTYTVYHNKYVTTMEKKICTVFLKMNGLV